MTKKPNSASDKEDAQNEGDALCPECGSQMINEDGETICPNCDSEIDFFGDDED